MTWVINGVSVCCSLGWTLNHEISFLLLYLLFLISQLSYFVFGTGCKIWLSKVQILWGSPEIWFSHSSEKSFFLLFLCLTLQISRVWLYLVGTVSSYSMMYSGHYTFCFNLLYLKSKSYAQKVLLLLQYI